MSGLRRPMTSTARLLCALAGKAIFGASARQYIRVLPASEVSRAADRELACGACTIPRGLVLDLA